jgi:hypothetical protein
MRLQVLNRKIHSWTAIVIAVPVLVIFLTGLLLQLKKQLPWVQPTEHRGIGKEPSLEWPREICRQVPEAEIRSWADIHRVDVRPSRGMLKVTAQNSWEIQLDIQTGKVLQTAYRRSDLIEALHDGSWFHDGVKWAIFLPAGAALVLLWLTGIYLFWLPIWVRWRRRRAGHLARISKG